MGVAQLRQIVGRERHLLGLGCSAICAPSHRGMLPIIPEGESFEIVSKAWARGERKRVLCRRVHILPIRAQWCGSPWRPRKETY
jgi:hypothetical protein